MWKGDKAEATAPIQTDNAETLKGLKAHDGRKGQGLGGAHSHLQPFSAEAPETTLLPKVTLASSSSQTEPWGH